MANKQNIARPQIQGAEHMHLLKRGKMLSGLQNVETDDGGFQFINQVFESGRDLILSRDKTENESMRLRAVSTLKNYRQQLDQTQTPEEFDELAKTATMALKASFDDAEGKKFWQEYGEGLSEANKRDMAHLRTEKMPEFGRNSLRKMLADSQNMLAQVKGVNGGDILSNGVKEIEETPFLDAEEKQLYRDDFLTTGILNYALQDVNTAEKMQQKYMPENADLCERLAKTKLLLDEERKQTEVQKERAESLNALQQKVALWQAKERGEIDAATYYVLQGDDDVSRLNSDTGLINAYQLMKKMHNGEELTTEEAGYLTQDLAVAYQQKEIDYDTAAAMQNRVIKQVNQIGGKTEYADRMIDALADQILMPDVAEESETGKIFMREKARLSFELYQAYDAEENALKEKYAASGQKITPALNRKITREALETVKDAYGFEMQKGEVFFDDMADVVKENYRGKNEDILWRQFYADAPYVADKKEYLQQLAQKMNKAEEKTAAATGLFGKEKQYAANEYAGVVNDGTIDEEKMKENNLTISKDLNFREQLSHLEGGLYTYPYFDSKNILTIGNGLNIRDKFYEFPWEDLKGNRINDMKVLEEEKEKLDKIRKEQEDIIHKYGKDFSSHMRKASSFENVTILRLPKSFLLNQEDKILESMEKELQQNIDNFNNIYSKKFNRKIFNLNEMPKEYAWALLELKYNLGGKKMNTKTYYNLFEGLIKGDKEQILKNLRRKVNNPNDNERNMWAQKLLKKTKKLPSFDL